MSAPAKGTVEVRHLSKRYRIGRRLDALTLREHLVELLKAPLRRWRTEPPSIWALNDVSFDIGRGEVVGIIGRNGAGKSTLLKLLSRIVFPTAGSIRVGGRVASLLEVGVGFHPELTGRENVYLNGSIMGMRKREVDARFDAIVEFAGVDQFIDTQIKHYSSGMRLRLGFAVAAHLDPDVLVVDEVLAVGDASFQKKCLNAMEGLQSSGRTVLFVSHNMAAVENLCSRAIWIDSGRIRMDGDARETIRAYMGAFGDSVVAGSDLTKANRLGIGKLRYTRIEFLGQDGTPCAATRCGDALVIRLHYVAEEPVPTPSFGFRLFTTMGTQITESNAAMHGTPISSVMAGPGSLDVEIESLNLLPGRYLLSLWITGPGGQPVYDGDVQAVLDVDPANVYGSGRMPDPRHGIMYFPQRWRVPDARPALDKTGTGRR
jgi:lipopolysaccharide transport system ATP-binding protein